MIGGFRGFAHRAIRSAAVLASGLSNRGNWWEADERPEPRSLGLLPSGSDPVGEWLVHRQPPEVLYRANGKGKQATPGGLWAAARLAFPSSLPGLTRQSLRDALCHPKRVTGTSPVTTKLKASRVTESNLVPPPATRRRHGSGRRPGAVARAAGQRRQLSLADSGAAAAGPGRESSTWRKTPGCSFARRDRRRRPRA